MEFEKQLEEWMKLDYVLPEDLPNIELYMDQVTTFLEEQLKNTKRFEDDKIFTKTMINNYTKNHLLPPSNKKKYSRNHMILLIRIKNSIFRNSLIFQGLPPIKYQNLMYFPLFLPL